MTAMKLKAGEAFPSLSVPKLGDGIIDLTVPGTGFDWKLIVVYRGKHCPLCTRYLQELNDVLSQINALGIDVVAISADSEKRAKDQMSEVNPNYDVGYNLSVEQMQQLGLYVSDVRLGMDVERPFSEPGLFVVNDEGRLQIIDISNVPFARPDWNSMLMGLKYIRNLDEEFPVNGSFS